MWRIQSTSDIEISADPKAARRSLGLLEEAVTLLPWSLEGPDIDDDVDGWDGELNSAEGFSWQAGVCPL